MLKHIYKNHIEQFNEQPPSGGCVLKQNYFSGGVVMDRAAAFGRLCVETNAEFVAVVDDESSRLRAAVC